MFDFVISSIFLDNLRFNDFIFSNSFTVSSNWLIVDFKDSTSAVLAFVVSSISIFNSLKRSLRVKWRSSREFFFFVISPISKSHLKSSSAIFTAVNTAAELVLSFLLVPEISLILVST